MDLTYAGKGSLSGREVFLRFRQNPASEEVAGGAPVCFSFPNHDRCLPATVEQVVATQRNTVLGVDGQSICFVEHLLACLHLMRLTPLEIQIDGQEIPLEDGSALVWYKLLNTWGQPSSTEPTELFALDRPLFASNPAKGSAVYACPAPELRLTYLFRYPTSGEQVWVSWSAADDIQKLIAARTFAPRLENEMLGLAGKVLSYDAIGFDQEFRFPHEPAFHKLLDLFGDLTLAGWNPLDVQAHFISYQGSHELNTQIAAQLRKLLPTSDSWVQHNKDRLHLNH